MISGFMTTVVSFCASPFHARAARARPQMDEPKWMSPNGSAYVDQYSGGETVRLVCASEYRKPECTAIPAAFGAVWIARLVFLRSCAGGGVLTVDFAVDFAPLAPSFTILCAGGCVLAVDFAPLAPSFAILCAGGCALAVDFAPLAPSLFAILRAGERPRLAAYSLPSIAPTCGGSRSR